MTEVEKYEITIYKRPVRISVVIFGKERFLREQAFLDKFLGRIPGSLDGKLQTEANYYILDENQLIAYQAFRRRLDVEFGAPD